MEYKYGKYTFFDLLVMINTHYFPNDILGKNVRENDESQLQIYNKLLENYFNKLNTNISLDEIIELSLNLTGYLWLHQPFYDGNTRTFHHFLKLVFLQLKYHLNFLENDKTDRIIPLFYDDNQKCIQNDIDNLKRRLTKINNG